VSLNHPHGPSYQCDLPDGSPPLSYTSAVGSCGRVDIVPFDVTGPQSITLTGTSVAGDITADSTSEIFIGPAPVITGIQGFCNQVLSNDVCANGHLYIYGRGFSRTGGNSVELANFPRAVTYSEGARLDFQDRSHTLIVLQLGELVSPGCGRCRWQRRMRRGRRRRTPFLSSEL